MAKKKLRIGVLFGGRSGEHEVSLLSAASILKAIDSKKYEIIPIGISKQGRWLTDGEAQHLLAGNLAKPAQFAPIREDDPEFAIAAAVFRSGEPLQIPAPAKAVPKPLGPVREEDPEFAVTAAVFRSGEPLQIPAPVTPLPKTFDLQASAELAVPSSPFASSIDVVFPVLHGTFGEDGTIQGLLELADVAYVGSGVLGSAVAMDKDAMKRIFAAAGLPQTPHVSLTRSEWRADPLGSRKLIEKSLNYPFFVKPANLGSSVGISKVHDRGELAAAMDLAAKFDRKIIVEEGVGGPGVKPRELEVAVLGNDSPEASVVGEIVPAKEFYDYEAKYELSGPDESTAIIPAKLTTAQQKQIRAMAIAAFKACDCAGLARVDFLMEPATKANPRPQIMLNEINTMPGFTSISMYPKLWRASGVSYKQLIDRLIKLALERHAEKLETAFHLK
jgi:D-alanine-D-alanine ligase